MGHCFDVRYITLTVFHRAKASPSTAGEEAEKDGAFARLRYYQRTSPFVFDHARRRSLRTR